MKKEIVNSQKAPKAIGPYSQAIAAGGFMFVSGQIPLDPHSGQVTGNSVSEQARVVMENIGAILEAKKLGFSDIVQATVYLKDLSGFGEFNAVYGEYFPHSPPARACVEVSRLPKDVLVEVAVIAYNGPVN